MGSGLGLGSLGFSELEAPVDDGLALGNRD
jgi:hypothetical protein